jgi:hypothetical protein
MLEVDDDDDIVEFSVKLDIPATLTFIYSMPLLHLQSVIFPSCHTTMRAVPIHARV